MTAIDDSTTAVPEPTDDGLGTMTLVEHLVELRRRLLICILVVVVATVAAWFFYNQLLAFMRSPYCNFVHHHQSKSISGCNLVTTGPLEGFTTRVKLSAYAGIALATPVWLWELWRFITPGLHKNEKRYIVPFVAGALALFGLGVTTAILVFPKALDWLISISAAPVGHSRHQVSQGRAWLRLRTCQRSATHSEEVDRCEYLFAKDPGRPAGTWFPGRTRSVTDAMW